MTALPDSIDIDLGATELSDAFAGDTLTVTINRPEKRNALTADGYHGIKRAAMIVADEPALNSSCSPEPATCSARAAT